MRLDYLEAVICLLVNFLLSLVLRVCRRLCKSNWWLHGYRRGGLPFYFQESRNTSRLTKRIFAKEQQDVRVAFQVDITSRANSCIYLSIRRSVSRSWHFMVPPTPLLDDEKYFCFESLGMHTVSYLFSKGYYIISVFYTTKQFPKTIAPNSLHKNPPKLHLRVIKPSVPSILAENRLLDEAFRNVRNDERDEIQEALQHWKTNAEKYKDQRMHGYLFNIKTKEDLYTIVHPRMQKALFSGNFSEILIPTATRVYRFPILQLNVSQHIVEEIRNAKQVFKNEELRLPNNVGRARGPTSGVVLSEIGLYDLSHALVKYILAPLGRIMYPLWGFDVDSFHAFSLHVVPSDHGEARAGESYLRTHIDICEFSMNICLGNTFQGGNVLFQNAGFGVNNGSAGYTEIPHLPGYAFLNLCQQFHGTSRHKKGARHSLVMRALSSSFRRSPAEVFYEKCGIRHAYGGEVAPGSTPGFVGKHESL